MSWLIPPSGGVSSLNLIGDVTVPSPVTDELISWNGSAWVNSNSVTVNGRLDINNGIALGGGAAPTLGTIGGSGPTAAAQSQWVEIDIGGTPHWIPVWV